VNGTRWTVLARNGAGRARGSGTPAQEERSGDGQQAEERRRSPTSGAERTFTVVDAPDWINVIAVTPAGEIVLVEQFRHGSGRVELEIPGGAVDPGEMPDAAALRELEEETAYRCRELHTIGVVEPNPAFQTNRCWTFLALGCEPSGTLRPDPAEEIAVRLEPLAALTRLIDEGVIGHALVVAAHDHLYRGIARPEPWADAVTRFVD